MSYLYQIGKEFLTTMKDRQDFIYSNDFHGEYVSSKLFFTSIFRNNLSKKHKRAFVVKSNGKQHWTCNSIDEFLEKENRYTYFTPQIYYHYKSRTKDKLSYLNCFVLDFDLAKDGTDRDYTIQELHDVIYAELGTSPHFIYETETEGNMNAVFLFKEISATENTVYLYESILKRMAIMLGADIGSTDASHIFRIPRKGVVQYKSNLDIDDIDSYKTYLEYDEVNERLEELRENFMNSKVVSLNEYQIMNLKSVQKLLNCDIDSYRNNSCFTLALLFYSLGKDQKTVENFIFNKWYPLANGSNFDTRYNISEVRNSIKSAYSGKYSGPSREWIEFLTDEPFPINLYRSSYIKKSEDDRVYLSKNTLRTRLIEWVKDNPQQQINQKDLASVLDVPLRSLKRNIKQLKDENILDVKTTQGRNSVTSFVIIDNKFVVDWKVKDTFELEHPEVRKQA